MKLLREKDPALPPAMDSQLIEEENQKLHDLYPNEYVALRDEWSGNRLRRIILVHSHDLVLLNEQLDLLPAEELPSVTVRFVDGPDTPVSDPFQRIDLPSYS